MMSESVTVISWLALAVGVFFFVAAAIGLVRFPDIYCRLHTVAKADTVGMGFLVLGFSIAADDWQSVASMVVIWVLVAAASAVSCRLLALYESENDKTIPESPPEEIS